MKKNMQPHLIKNDPDYHSMLLIESKNKISFFCIVQKMFNKIMFNKM